MPLWKANIDAWSDSGSAKDLTGSLVAGTGFKTRGANRLDLDLTVGGDAATSVDLQVQISDDGGTTYTPMPAVNSVVGGAVDVDDMTVNAPGTVGQHMVQISVPPGVYARVSAKVTGSGGTTTLIAEGRLTQV